MLPRPEFVPRAWWVTVPGLSGSYFFLWSAVNDSWDWVRVFLSALRIFFVPIVFGWPLSSARGSR